MILWPWPRRLNLWRPILLGSYSIAVGPPQSEKFCQQVIADGRSVGVGLCIGSSISVVTGRLDAAPAWMEHSGWFGSIGWSVSLGGLGGDMVRGLMGLGLRSARCRRPFALG